MFNLNKPAVSSPVRLSMLCLMAWTCAPALALTTAPDIQSPNLQVTPAPPAAPPSQLVRELLEEDARRALAEEQRKRNAPPPPAGRGGGIAVQVPPGTGAKDAVATAPASLPPPPPPPAPQPRLKAIIGVDGHLSAIVSLAGKDSLYAAGQQMPVAGQGTGLRLVRIETPCVHFVDKNNQAVSMCLREVQP